MEVGVKVNFIQMIPTAPNLVPNGSYFLDSSNGNAATIKDVGGSTVALQNPAASLTIKQMQAAAPIPNRATVSKRPDGKIEIADADNANGQQVIGVALSAATAVDELINVLLVGANLTGALTGLGFTPGDEVYISNTGGYTNDPNTIANPDLLIKIGIADNAAGVANATVVDLILFPEVVSEP